MAGLPMYLCGSRPAGRVEEGLQPQPSAGPIDTTFSERLAGAITPMRIELALAPDALEERDQAIGAQWRMPGSIARDMTPSLPSAAMKPLIPPTA